VADLRRYFVSTQESAGHTPIYKVHKYFARRPHNQFRAIIDFYVPDDGLVLDCFSGGGVSLVEGLSAGKRVISVDTNEIATLVQLLQVSPISESFIDEALEQITRDVPPEIVDWYRTDCRNCPETAEIRWFERAYLVKCPACMKETSIANSNKKTKSDGKRKAGTYICECCQHEFKSVDTLRQGSVILSLRVKCSACGFHASVKPKLDDIERDKAITRNEEGICRDFAIQVPRDEIPSNWDRQLEDALIRKGFTQFADLFSPRNRMVLAYLIELLRNQSATNSESERLAKLGLVSSLIRYVNNMTFCTDGWMDGRPVAWAKHAYWTPNQFVEVNPFEYLSHRAEAFRRAARDRRNRGIEAARRGDIDAVISKTAQYAIVRGDSRKLRIPDASIDAVVTDPPFGSNVQYGELTHLWSVWLRDTNPFGTQLFDLSEEILVHRKAKESSKSLQSYSDGLEEVFRECFRVLRSDGVLIFTFNNSDPGAWYAVMRAALNAGFRIEDEGIEYLEAISAYRDTAHLRFDEKIQGDVLYTFIKGQGTSCRRPDSNWLRRAVGRLLENGIDQQSRRFLVDVHLAAIRECASRISSGADASEIQDILDHVNVGRVKQLCEVLERA